MATPNQLLSFLQAQYAEAMDNYKYRDRLIVQEFNLVFVLTAFVITTSKWILGFYLEAIIVISYILIQALRLLKKDIFLNKRAKKIAIDKAKAVEKVLTHYFKNSINKLKPTETEKNVALITEGLANQIGDQLSITDYGPEGNFSELVLKFINVLIYSLYVSCFLFVIFHTEQSIIYSSYCKLSCWINK